MNFHDNSAAGSAAAAVAAVRSADHHHEQQLLAAEAVRQAVERCHIERVSVVDLHDQNDQVWRNFATSAKFYKSGNFLTVYFLFGKISTLANLFHYWANFHCFKWRNIEN